jgi:methionyl-tRNA formyltransferase
MKNNVKIGLYLMTSKGLSTLQAFVSCISSKHIAYVVAAKDNGVVNDYYEDIIDLAQRLELPVYDRTQALPLATHLIAVSWRWLIKINSDQTLIVFHDSLLPRYRGFAPLPCALINGDKRIGVTALMASEEYDRGPIIDQEVVEIDYPIKISAAIETLEPCYKTLTIKVATSILQNELAAQVQNENEATYSLWRDEEDYLIDWKWDAARIKRFIDALGFPYKGASTKLDGETFRVLDCEVVPDVIIENRTAGKVIFTQNGLPVVVCGSGLLKISHLQKEHRSENALPLPRFRSRFT